MKLARVVATVVSTINSPIYDNRRLLLCDLLDAEGRPTGKYTIAIDRVDAGAGETVLVLDEGNSARQMLAAPDAPVRAIVAGIVDEVTLESSRRPHWGTRARNPRVPGGEALEAKPSEAESDR